MTTTAVPKKAPRSKPPKLVEPAPETFSQDPVKVDAAEAPPVEPAPVRRRID